MMMRIFRERRLPSHQEIKNHIPRWARIPVGLLLIVGGLLGFLPILGFWMLPLGLLILLVDVPVVQRTWERFRTWAHRKLHGDPVAAAPLRPSIEPPRVERG